MSYKLYPVTKTELQCNDYSVKVNGESVTLDTARVSAIPFNRRWPGHQRQLDQSEIIQFLSLETNESLNFEITPNKPFEKVKIRPASLGIVPEIKDGKIFFTLNKPAYFTVEPYGRNHALHIFADPVSEYNVDFNDPNVIYFGKGEYDVGLIELSSNQTLFIDEGAVVYACVHAADAENIKILGRGILDNSRNKEIILFETNAEKNEWQVNNAKRENTVVLEYCNGILIDGITIRDSLVYNIRPVGCSHLVIKNVKIIGCWRYNSDGIDMINCVGAHISNCFIRTFDDSICLKGIDCIYEGDVENAVCKATYRNGKVYDVFKDVLIEDCVIWNDWGRSLEIGAETKAEEIHTVTFRNCDIIHVTSSVLDCTNVDYADVHDIIYSDINIETDEIIPQPFIQQSDDDKYENVNLNFMPAIIMVQILLHPEYSAGSGTRRGKNRNFLFKNINVIGDKTPRIGFAGYDNEHKTENITISNLCLNGKPIEKLPVENFGIGNYVENVQIKVDPYAQMDKNTVEAVGQLKETECIVFDNPDGNGKRVMFVGNSMTLHGIRPEVGWYKRWGMAASSKEKDYVHILESKIKETDENAAFCICNVAEWEWFYKTGAEKLPLYEQARNFGADIIVLRFVENVEKRGYDPEIFKREYKRFVKYLDGTGKAKFIVTTGFWRHPADEELKVIAKEIGVPCVELGDLGENDKMKAIGLFEHKGVSNHPGDEGMKVIAERIFVEVKKLM